MARRYIKVYEEFGDGKHESIHVLGVSALYEIATLPPEEREKAHTLSSGETKKVDEMTVRELQEVKRQLKEKDLQLKQAKKSEEIALKKLEEAESKEPEIIERTKEVVPDHIKDELEATKRQLEFVNRQLNELKKEQIDTDDFNEDEAERERKKLEWEAEKNVLEFKIKVDRFLKEVAITAFMKGAIATSSKSTKDKLYQSVEELKEFTSQMEIALRGRIQV